MEILKLKVLIHSSCWCRQLVFASCFDSYNFPTFKLYCDIRTHKTAYLAGPDRQDKLRQKYEPRFVYWVYLYNSYMGI